jgi:hypothetical protein
MNILSILVGALLAAVAVFGTDMLLMQRGTNFIELGWPGMVLFLTIAGVAAWLGRVLLIVMLVLAWRPRTSVSFSRPKQCASFWDWCSSSWDIRTPSSRQTGHRVFGLNLGIYGALPAHAIPTPDRPTKSL